MNPFREKTPSRRLDRDECEHYSSYKDTLQEDFNKRCGYCDDSDGFRIRNYTIDHFVPRNPKDFTHDIKPNYYYNLVYACWYCNSNKSNKWITKDPNIHNNGEIGFVEPTSEDYTNLFKRDKEGQIICNGVNSNLAHFIIIELNLWHPVHSITWRLEKFDKIQKTLSEQIEKSKGAILETELESIRSGINDILVGLFQSLFNENE